MSPLGDKLPVVVSTYIPSAVLTMELRHFGLSIWLLTSAILILGSLNRVLNNESVVAHNLRFSALSKLVTPFLIAVAPFWLPKHIIENETRLLAISMGLLMSFLTMKMICFSMAKQSYAAIQMEAFPYWAVIILIQTDHSNHYLLNNTVDKIILGALCVWYAYRLLDWSKKAIAQICQRLDIYCFSIKHPKPKSE